MSVVNGYICYNCNDELVAKRGKDPHAPAGTPAGQSDKADKAASFDDQLAVIFGGTLKDLNTANAVKPAASAQDTHNDPQNKVDLLV